jgi:hypothetical protein
MRGRFRFHWRRLAIFAGSLAAFAVIAEIDKGSGLVSRAWLFVFPAMLALASLMVCLRLWRVRGRPEAARKVAAQGLYGVLPPKWRNWLFP